MSNTQDRDSESVWEMLQVLMVANWMGLHLYSGRPRILGHPLKLIHNPERDAESESQSSNLQSSWGESLPAARTPHMVPLKQIHLRVMGFESGRELEACIAINLRSERIDWDHTTPWLFGTEHLGSAELGVAVVSAPLALLTAPVLYLISRYWVWREYVEGMSRYGVVILELLRGQLPLDVEELLRSALKHSWAFEKKQRQPVTLTEAHGLLSGLNLCAYETPNATELGEELPGTYQELAWYEDGDECYTVARGHIANLPTDEIHVRGSTFTGKEAQDLSQRFRTRVFEPLDPA